VIYPGSLPWTVARLSKIATYAKSSWISGPEIKTPRTNVDTDVDEVDDDDDDDDDALEVSHNRVPLASIVRRTAVVDRQI